MLGRVVDHLLEDGEVGGRQCGEHAQVFGGLALEIGQRPDAVGPAAGERFLGEHVAAGDQQFERAAAADDAGDGPGGAAVHADGALDAVVADLDVVGAEADVAHVGDLPAVAERPAGDERDDGLGEVAQREQEGMVDGDRGVDARLRLHPVEVVARAEGALPRPAQRHDADIGPARREVDQRLQLAQQPEGKRVQPLGPIERDPQNPVRVKLPNRLLPLPVRKRLRRLRQVAHVGFYAYRPIRSTGRRGRTDGRLTVRGRS